jgi:beta-glucosidase
LGENITAIVTLENKGNYAGEEVVQLYIRDIVGSVTRPVKELKGFKRIHLKPGESQEVSFTINTTELAFFNQEMREVTEPGEFQLWIGGSSQSDLQTSFTVE